MALIASHLKLMQESFWWWQCSDRYIISLFPHLHTPFLPFSPSLISLMVSVDVSENTMFTYLLSDWERPRRRNYWLSQLPTVGAADKTVRSGYIICASHVCPVIRAQVRKSRWPSRPGSPVQYGMRRGLIVVSSPPLWRGGGGGGGGGENSSVVRAPDSWLKGRGFESLLERRENFLLQGRLSVLTLISVSVPPPCYHSST